MYKEENNTKQYFPLTEKLVYVITIVVSISYTDIRINIYDGAVMVFCFYSFLFVKNIQKTETNNKPSL